MEETGKGLAEDEQGEEEEFVEESAEISSMIKRVIDSEGRDAEVIYDRWKQILYKYQEQAQLLDAYLEDIVVPLSTLLREHATASESASEAAMQQIQGICRLLSVLVVVRGYKTVVKFFPHEAQDLERVLSVFSSVKARAANIRTEEEGIAVWESQSILMLWLSMLILVPFDLATIDSTAIDMKDARTQPYTQLVFKLLGICQQCLHQPGSVREMGALLLGRMLTRPDMGAALGDYITWAEGALATVNDLQAPFLLPGVLHSLCFVFKLGQRSRLLPHTHKVWGLLMGPLVMGNPVAAGSALARKLGIKLLQRLALTFLEPRLAPWRYQRDSGGDLALALGSAKEPQGASHDAAEGDNDEDDGEYEIAEEIEDVVERLLTGLRDKDTVVRWSVAKGIGRVTGCLPQELADEVVAQVLELFRPTESDAAWHGGCLALAELARRGLLLPPRLPVVTPIVQRALAYDVRRGPHSIGAHVRDAAAYVCWACARAYEPHLLADSVQVLASSLLVGACYDRDVNCRRAAAAAFQEAVGRLGNFPHGMEIIAVADYFAVGNINQAYMRVAPFVGSFPEYRRALAEHLVHTKLKHWDKSLRELSARACAALVPCFGEYFSTEALDVLLPLCLDTVLEVRHGALMGVSELLPALKAAGQHLTPERTAQVAGLVPAIDKARLYRGKGGEVMREAVGRLVAALSSVGLPLSRVQHAKVAEALDENLRHPQPYIQAAAVEALKQYTRAYIEVDSGAAESFRNKQLIGFLGRLHDANVAVRRGFAAALGALPAGIIGPQAHQVVDALIDGMQPEESLQDRDVDSRVSCTRALGAACLTLLTPTAAGDVRAGVAPAEALDLLLLKVLPCLHQALGDYTIDNRGDVGSWIRDAAMQVLVHMVQLQAQLQAVEGGSWGSSEYLSGVVGAAVGAILKQAVERISRVREAALRHLRALLDDPLVQPLMPAGDALNACLPHQEKAVDDAPMQFWGSGGSASLETVPRLVQLLPVHQYTGPLLEGLVASVGCVDASLAKVASAALVDVVGGGGSSGGEASRQLLQSISAHLLEIWGRHGKTPRMSGPLMRCADLLVTRTELLTTRVPAAAAAAPSPGPAAAGASSSPLTASDSPGPTQPLPDVLVAVVRAETRQCSDVPRLLDASSLLCHLLPCANPCQASAVAGLLVLLVSRYPTVRRHTAEQLYLQLLAMEPEQLPGGLAVSEATAQAGGAGGCVSAEELEQAQELLLMTSWDGEMDEAKAARDLLAGLLKVPVPAMKAPAGFVAGARNVVRDENASYNALVSDVSRGM